MKLLAQDRAILSFVLTSVALFELYLYCVFTSSESDRHDTAKT